MRTLKVLIVDDDEASLHASRMVMEKLVEPTGIYCVRTAVETMRVLSEQAIDLAFLDIDMPETDGFSIADYIDHHCPEVRYVFLTGHADFAAKSYDYEPLDFLIKPVNVIRLNRALERHENQNQHSRDHSGERIVMDTDEGFVLISPAEVAYVAKDLRQIKVHCLDGRVYVVRHSSLDEVEEFFSDYAFFRIHQSYLVPLCNIISIRPAKFSRAYEALINGQICLPMSRNKYLKLRNHLADQGVQFL